MKIDAIWQPENQQRIFRALMEAMARPGSLHSLDAWLDGARSYRGVLASLLDAGTTLSDCHDLLEPNDWPLLQARQEITEKADYLLCQGSAHPNGSPKVGSLSCPDQSATLLIQVENLGNGGSSLMLQGPGIQSTCSLEVSGLEPAWLELREEYISFPLGIDCILLDQKNITAIPRTTKVKVLS
ncbi:MAG: phosphonate C-P lyase system protein PhnH [Thermodesulfobacteriota bacterium]|nr:phosphonate C-P lyase system protein PhnH [Thermodesulfobacteriota bacterium]